VSSHGAGNDHTAASHGHAHGGHTHGGHTHGVVQTQHEASVLFTVGDEFCRIPLRRLHGIAPCAALEPSNDAEVLGMLHLRGEIVPVVDLQQTVYGTPTPVEMGSRILLLMCARADGSSRLVGALASDVVAMARDDDDEAQLFDPCELLGSLLTRLP
jgi:chemotaxis signal transduction protein